ncbi:MAG: diphosphomevalonate decarboxylase [Chloroflexota bacterium]|nr:MAG: diphosphomevalonate decarboxylase [Bellilinea sp.]
MFKKSTTVGVATAIAHPNIAFIKYWGNRDDQLRIPANGSISMNLEGLITRTTVRFESRLKNDTLILNQKLQSGKALQRVSDFLDIIREKANFRYFAEVVSENNFPTGSGLASSAAAFAALSLAASKAAGLNLNRQELSALARRGSGSACRSIPAGFVEWLPGNEDDDSYAISIAPPTHWELLDCIAIVESDHKSIGSTEGHQLAATSPLQAARVEDAPRRLDICRRAILHKDFESLAHVVELDSNLMHAVMMTSTPPLMYWSPASIDLMKKVRDWREEGLPVCYTLDAGPNVHILCLNEALSEVKFRLQQIPAVEQVLVCRPGGAATLLE